MHKNYEEPRLSIAKMNVSPRVSVIIPTLNGGRLFARVLASLSKQSLVPDEILVIDSSSDDDTLESAGRYNTSIKTIDRADFDHGGTRSLGGRISDGDILVYLTQDAVLEDAHSLANLVAPFADPKIAAAYGRQLPYPDATCFAEHLRAFNYPSKSSVRCWEDRVTYGFKTAFISNSFAAYRKQPLERVGFFEEGMLFGEDTHTLAKLLSNGFCVAYAADACVYHSHNYSVLQDFKRYFDIGVFHARHQSLIEQFGPPTAEGKLYVQSEFSLLIKRKKYWLLPESCVRNLAKFLAYNLGKRYHVIPRRLSMKWSMNRKWWMNPER